MRVKLTAKHPRPSAPDRAPVRSGSPSGRKPVRSSAPARPAGAGSEASAVKRTQGSTQKPAGRPANPRGASAAAKPGGKPFSGERRGPAAGKSFSDERRGPAAGKSFSGERRGPATGKSFGDERRGPAAGKPFSGERRGPAAGKPSGQRPAFGDKPGRPAAAGARSTTERQTERTGAAPRGTAGPRTARPTDARPSTRRPYAETSSEPRRTGAGRAATGPGASGTRPARTRAEGAAPRGERAEYGTAPRRRDGGDFASQRGARPVKRAATSDERRGPPTGRPARGEGRPGSSDAPRQRREGDSRTARPARASYEDRPAPASKRPSAKRTESRTFDRERPVRPAAKGPRSAAATAHEDAAADGTVRLSKRMSELGLCSRREADEWIENGWVRVDGERIDTLGSRVRPEQQIEISSDARASQARQVTILLNKPVGFVSGQAEDGYAPAVTLIKPENRWDNDRSPLSFVPSHLRTLAPAGRLDIDSTGLLVLTQDGRIAKLLIGENSGVEKEYLVRVTYGERETDIDQHFPPEQLALLRHGLSLDGVPLKPAKVSWQNGEQLRFVLREGKKRQIRRMCELVGLHVVGLKRVRMGRVALGQLPQGQWRYLLPDEVF